MSTTPVLYQSSAPEAPSEEWWAATERTAARLAKVSWTPEAFRGKPADIMAAGLALATIGRDLTPMTLKLVYVVKGTVDFMVDLIVAQVHEHGHEIWVEESDEHHATVAGQRRGSSHIHRVTFTVEDAKRAGLVGKDVWKSYVKDMLVARAAKRCAKRVCPEALLAMPPPLQYAVTDSGRIKVANIVHELDPDDDGVVDGEIIEQGEDPGLTPDQMSGGAGEAKPGVADPKVDPAPSGPIAGDEPEGGDNGGAAVVEASTAPLPRLATGGIDWRHLAKLHEVSEGKLLLQARKFAAARGLEPPGELREITDEQLVADVVDWLGPA
jgi:hypothetical protein